MPFLLILGILLLVTGLIVAILSKPVKGDEKEYANSYGIKTKASRKTVWRGAGFGAAAAGVFLIVLTLFTIVPTQSVGVVTSFNKPTGRTLDSGLHPKAPWHKVKDMDGTVQKIDNIGDSNEDKKIAGRSAVRLSSTNSIMYLDNAFRWKIKQDAADQLYLDWRKGSGDIVEDHIREGLVEKELAAALNTALANVDPYDPNKAGQDVPALEKAVVDNLVGADRKSGRIGAKIEVVSFSIIKRDYDKDTEARIAAIQQEVQRTKQAAQSVQTAAQEKLRNEKLAASVSKDPNVLVAKCFDTQQKMVEAGQSLQGVPSCWPMNGVTLTRPAQ